MRDVIDFEAPYGGRIAEVLVLNTYMLKLIRQRNRYLATAAERAAKSAF
jgi:hypothetical protein